MKKPAIVDDFLEELKAWFGTIDRKTWIHNATIVGAVLGFILFLLVPMIMHNNKMGKETKRLANRIRQAKTRIARIPQMTEQKELFGAQTERIRKEFFEAQETDQLIEIIATTASEAGVKITASRPASPIELPAPFGDIYIPVSYELMVQGSYHAIGIFVNNLERYPKNFAVHDLQITAGQKAGTVHQCTLTLTAFLKRPIRFM